MKICIWCKYGEEKANEIKEKTLRQTMDARTCPKCGKTAISGTFMEEE